MTALHCLAKLSVKSWVLLCWVFKSINNNNQRGSYEVYHEFHETCHSVTFYFMKKKTPNDAVTPQCQSQFTPKMKANAVPRLLSSLVWIDHYDECNWMTSFMEFVICRNAYIHIRWLSSLWQRMRTHLISFLSWSRDREKTIEPRYDKDVDNRLLQQTKACALQWVFQIKRNDNHKDRSFLKSFNNLQILIYMPYIYIVCRGIWRFSFLR